LDPFTGSGTTGIAAVLEGFSFLGIEQSEEYALIARSRIQEWSSNSLQPALELEAPEPETDESSLEEELDGLFG